MENGMTDYQFISFLKMLRMLIHRCESVEEAEEVIDKILDEESSKDTRSKDK